MSIENLQTRIDGKAKSIADKEKDKVITELMDLFRTKNTYSGCNIPEESLNKACQVYSSVNALENIKENNSPRSILNSIVGIVAQIKYDDVFKHEKANMEKELLELRDTLYDITGG